MCIRRLSLATAPILGQPPRFQFGVTLIELIVSIVILSIAATGILMVLTRVTLSSADPMLREQAIAIAQSYMEEILLHPLADPDGVSGEVNRSLYDDIWDYDGLADHSGAIDQNGNSINGLESYMIDVDIDNFGVNLGGDPATRILVTVTHSGYSGINIPISAYRMN